MVGIITSTLRQYADRDLIRLKFPTDKFFLVQGSDDTVYHKPDPRVFDTALSLVADKQIGRDAVAYVGDALMDYYAARDAGIGFIGVATGLIPRDTFIAAGAPCVDSLPELLPFFETGALKK